MKIECSGESLGLVMWICELSAHQHKWCFKPLEEREGKMAEEKAQGTFTFKKWERGRTCKRG